MAIIYGASTDGLVSSDDDTIFDDAVCNASDDDASLVTACEELDVSEVSELEVTSKGLLSLDLIK